MPSIDRNNEWYPDLEDGVHTGVMSQGYDGNIVHGALAGPTDAPLGEGRNIRWAPKVQFGTPADHGSDCECTLCDGLALNKGMRE